MPDNPGCGEGKYIPGHAGSSVHERRMTVRQAELLGNAKAFGIIVSVNLLMAMGAYFMARVAPANPCDKNVCPRPQGYQDDTLLVALLFAALDLLIIAYYAYSRFRSHGTHRHFILESRRRAAIKARKRAYDRDPQEVIAEQIVDVLGTQLRRYGVAYFPPRN
jgi:hypothetical protein